MLRPLALGTGAALFALTPAIANHSTGVHWAGNGQNLVLKVNTAITPEWNVAVGTAISDWNQSTELTLNIQAAAVDRRTCAPIVGQILICNFPYGRQQYGWEAIATVYYRVADNHIVAATTKLNDSYYYNRVYDTPAWRAIGICHELAHDLGLDHQDTTRDNVNLGTCMDYTNAPAGGVYKGFDYGPSDEHPDAHDYEELSIIYDHDDGFSTATAATNFGVREIGNAVPQALQGIGDSPAEWGRAIHRDRQGRPDVFLKDLGSGKRAVTHVSWATGEGPR